MCEEINCDNDMFEMMLCIYNLPFTFMKIIDVAVYLELKYQKKYKLIAKENNKNLELTCSNEQCNWGIRIEYDHDEQILGKTNIRVKCGYHKQNEDITDCEGICDQYEFNEHQQHLINLTKELFKKKHWIENQRRMEIEAEEKEEEEEEEDESNNDEDVSFFLDDMNIDDKRMENLQRMEIPQPKENPQQMDEDDSVPNITEPIEFVDEIDSNDDFG